MELKRSTRPGLRCYIKLEEDEGGGENAEQPQTGWFQKVTGQEMVELLPPSQSNLHRPRDLKYGRTRLILMPKLPTTLLSKKTWRNITSSAQDKSSVGYTRQ